MLRNSSPPIVPRRDDAPMTATESGSKNGLSDAATATWSRSSRRSTTAGCVRSRCSTTSTTPPCSARAVSKPGVVEDSQHRGIAGEDFRDELLDTDLRRVLGEPLEQAGTDPSAVELIGDRERDFGAFRIAETDVRGERDRPGLPPSSTSSPTSEPWLGQSVSSATETVWWPIIVAPWNRM